MLLPILISDKSLCSTDFYLFWFVGVSCKKDLRMSENLLQVSSSTHSMYMYMYMYYWDFVPEISCCIGNFLFSRVNTYFRFIQSLFGSIIIWCCIHECYSHVENYFGIDPLAGLCFHWVDAQYLLWECLAERGHYLLSYCIYVQKNRSLMEWFYFVCTFNVWDLYILSGLPHNYPSKQGIAVLKWLH